MAFEVPDHFSRSFTTNTELLLQSLEHFMAGTYSVGAYVGEQAQVVKQFGSVEFAEKTGRLEDTNFSEIEHRQRWVFPTDYDLALPVEKEDDIRQLNSPQSDYVEAMAAAWNRKKDLVIYDALLGSAQTGKQGSTATSFDTSGQQIAASSAGLTIAKLREARKILVGNKIKKGEERFLACTEIQINDLLESTEVTSSDYNTVKALVQGEVDAFMGFRFIEFPGMKDNANSLDSSSDRRVIAWVSSGIHLGVWNALESHIDQRPDKKYLTQVFMKGTIGATRTQEGKVVEILCNEP